MSALTDLIDSLQATGMWEAIRAEERETEDGLAMLVMAVLDNFSPAQKADLIAKAQAWVDFTPSSNPRVQAVRDWLAANT